MTVTNVPREHSYCSTTCAEDAQRHRSYGLSKGGEHAMANVQLAHLDCNMRKGNRSAGEQFRLIG